MKFLKGLALAILGFLLSLSLCAFGFALMLNQTILNPDFAVSQVDRLDIPSLAGEFISKQISSEQIPQEIEPIMPIIAEAIDNTIADLEPWIKEQVSTGIYSFYDYLEGRSESLSLVISLEPVKESFRENLREAFFQSPLPELQELSPDEKEWVLAEIYAYAGLDGQVPATFEFDEASLEPEVMAQLEQAKQIVGYIHLTYNTLIGLILLLILGIVLLNREVRGSTRQIGITFLICGIIGYVGALVAKNVAGTQLTQLDMPVYLQTWMPQLIADTLAPLEMYGIGLLAAGVVLLVVSFVYKRRQTEF